MLKNPLTDSDISGTGGCAILTPIVFTPNGAALTRTVSLRLYENSRLFNSVGLGVKV